MSAPDQAELLAVAEAAARAAAVELRERFGPRQPALASKSTPTDPVSEADLAAEAAIRGVLGERRPTDTILGEEGGETVPGQASALRWIVDPLDGTANFLYGIPQFAVSVAVEDGDGGLAGVVLDPVREECFTAVRDGAARLNGEPFRHVDVDDLGHALVATGFGYAGQTRARQAAVVSRVLPRVRDIRRAGAAALDLAWCAYGRMDAYYERGVKPWDIAAGRLIAARAGLSVRALAGDARDASGVVVAPAGLIDELYGLVGG
ncbi:MAG TPA: inositol monophosphatase family protein [Solirubrobacteraceae bacterium]|nr:inositol monophosphatase family protein [Solirubrobacteraceae bacterium]